MLILRAMDPSDGGGAGDSSQSDDGNQDQSDNQSFYLPSSFPGRENYKAGDTITLKVVGADADGDLEVQCQGPDDGSGDQSDWKSDLKANVPNTPGGY